MKSVHTYYARTHDRSIGSRSRVFFHRFSFFKRLNTRFFFLFTKRELPSLLSRGRGWHGTRKREKKRGKRPRDIPGPGKRSCIPRFPVPERSRPAMGSTTIPLSLLSSAFHAAPSPPPSWTVYLPPAERTLLPSAITPARPSAVLVPQTTLSPRSSPSSQPAFPSPASSLITLGGLNAFITRPFSLQTFGIGAEGGGPESASGGWKFEKEESGDRVGRRGRKEDGSA